MSWHNQQLLFKQSIQNGSFVAGALFRNSINISAEKGLEIYHNAHEIRLREFLLADYPVLAKLFGNKFEELSKKYRLAFPSQSPNAADYGRYLADFLRTQPLAPIEAAAPDLALLEWRMNELLHFPGLPSFGLENIALATEADWLKAKLIFDPHFNIISSEFPIDEIYENEAWIETRAPSKLLLWRNDGEVFYKQLSHAEVELIGILQAGNPLSVLLDNDLDLSPEVFAEWLSKGFLRGISW